MPIRTNEKVLAEQLLSQATSCELPPLESAADRAVEAKNTQPFDFGLFQMEENQDGSLRSEEPSSDFSISTTRKFNPFTGPEGSVIRSLTVDSVQRLSTIAVQAARVVLDNDALLPARYTAKLLCEVIRKFQKRLAGQNQTIQNFYC